MERNPFSIDMNVYTFLEIKLFQKLVEFSFLKNAIIVFLSLTRAQKCSKLIFNNSF